MSDLSTYLQQELLDHFLVNGTYTKPATLYVALFTANPGESGATGEVSGGSYARVALTNNNVNFPLSPTTGTPTKTNGETITWPTASASWGTVTHWAIYDHVSNSTNMIAHGALATPRTVASSDTPRAVPGALSITLTSGTAGGLTSYAKRVILDHVFGGPAYTSPTLVYVGLGTALSGETITEWADAQYTRQATTFGAASGDVSASSSSETFSGTGVVTPATITHYGIWDDALAGNLLFVGSLNTSRTLVASDAVTLGTGACTVTLQ
jgi:hypothetical protein